jgi:signal transduction histidine kinase
VNERELEEQTPEQALVEERLRAEESERLLPRLLLERLREGVVAIDRRLRVAFANTEAMRILAPARLAVGHPLPDPWPDVSLPELAVGLFAPDAEPVERQIESRGSERVLSLVGLPAENTDVALLVIVDVSARERRERAEREFVANAAHELRTPLAAITSAIEVLQSGAKESPEPRDRFLGHLERETQRLGLLTQSLLLLARVQSGSEEPRMEVIDVAQLLDEVAAALSPSGRVEVRVECRPEVAALGNRELAAQALAAVAANAVKYTREGCICLSGRSANGLAVIEVTDSGPGIPESERELVRHRFYRVGDRARDGFGLGLAIADQAIAAIGGTLEIDSPDAGGTTIRIALPGAELVS